MTLEDTHLQSGYHTYVNVTYYNRSVKQVHDTNDMNYSLFFYTTVSNENQIYNMMHCSKPSLHA